MTADRISFPRRGLKPSDGLLQDPTIVWFDPGETVGWSMMQIGAEELADPRLDVVECIKEWEHGQINAQPPEQVLDRRWSRRWGAGFGEDTSYESYAVRKMARLVANYPGCAVGTESFVIRQFNQDASFLSPVRIQAGFDYAMWMVGKQPFRQQPSEAKTTVTDARLKQWGLYVAKGAERHARDADRHAITFLRKCKDLNKGKARRAIAWPHIYGEGAPHGR